MQISNLAVNDVISLATFFNLRGSAKGYLRKGGGFCIYVLFLISSSFYSDFARS
jgi:hypothetical protein